MHKIIILDEADSMTEAAQQALRMIMTEYSHTTRFALACNDSAKIIEPIQSRCAIMRFSRLADKEVVERLVKVIKAENIEHDQKGLEALVYLSDGDMRGALNNLQATVAGCGKVTYENVFKVCDQPKPEAIQEIIVNAKAGNFDQVSVCGTLARLRSVPRSCGMRVTTPSTS
jgi:replication factor C subunit 2/4